MTNPAYQWDKAFVEKKVTLYTNLQMGLVGAALMLMMMDLSKLYFLAPLVGGLILVSWYKSHLNKLHDEFKNYSVEIAPKSLLVRIPEKNAERRVLFREIEDMDLHSENLVPIVTLYLEEDKEKVVLPAMKEADEFLKQLRALKESAEDKT